MKVSQLGRRAWLAGAAALIARPAAGDAAEARPRAGQKLELSILGIADWRPSAAVRAMAPGFVTHAKQQYGYEVDLNYQDAPLAALYPKAAAALGARPTGANLAIADSQWLSAFAARKLIRPLNPVLHANERLEIEWYAPEVRKAYQLYPDGTDNRWAMPQSGDVLALFVRRDWLDAPGEKQAFRTRYALDLPQCWEDFEKLTWDNCIKVLEFFTRPDQGRHGFASQMSAAYDALSSPALSFIFGHGGQIWDAATGQVEGILNTDANARALAQYVSLLKYQPEAAREAGTDEVTALFTQGKVFSALQWAGAGPAMIPEALRNKAMVVPPPGFRAAGQVTRNYVIGGQVWVLGDGNDAMQTQVCVDFLTWWYHPETALQFAKLGGLPCDEATLSRPDFDAIQPWFRTYKYMLRHSADFWHDPDFAEMLALQQSAFAAYAAGKVTDARLVLDLLACRQQAILFGEGSAERRPSEACRTLER